MNIHCPKCKSLLAKEESGCIHISMGKRNYWPLTNRMVISCGTAIPKIKIKCDFKGVWVVGAGWEMTSMSKPNFTEE
jgi:hypothetical protein